MKHNDTSFRSYLYSSGKGGEDLEIIKLNEPIK